MPDLGPPGHSRPAHRVHGWCSHCPGRTVAEELAAWHVHEDARDTPELDHKVQIEQLTTRLGQYADRAMANGGRAERLQAEALRLAAIVDRVRATAHYHLNDSEGDVNPLAAGILADLDQDHGDGHIYLSTGCRHGNHDYCKAKTGAIGSKAPATCKFCSASCICPCHEEDS